MMQYAESQLTFNLLALCQTPLGSHRQQIADSLASLIQMRVRMGSNEDFKDLVSGEEQPLDVQNSTQMAEYGLQPSDIGQDAISDESARKLSRPDLELGDTYDLYLSFIARTKQAMRAYQDELRKDSEAVQQKATQSAPWGPAIHKWVTALADKEELVGIIRHTS
jgi:ubiquitin carboxyl-terminal hydrolase L5